MFNSRASTWFIVIRLHKNKYCTNVVINCHTDFKFQLVNIRLPQEQGRMKGFGYAEFEDRESLIDALSLNDTVSRLSNAFILPGIALCGLRARLLCSSLARSPL